MARSTPPPNATQAMQRPHAQTHSSIFKLVSAGDVKVQDKQPAGIAPVAAHRDGVHVCPSQAQITLPDPPVVRYAEKGPDRSGPNSKCCHMVPGPTIAINEIDPRPRTLMPSMALPPDNHVEKQNHQWSGIQAPRSKKGEYSTAAWRPHAFR